MRQKLFAIGSAVAIGCTSLGSAALANGYQEDGSWQFQTSADKANLAAVANVMQLQRGGYYDSFHSTYNTINNSTTNFAGSQINCSVGASSVGNSGTTTAAVSAASPTTTTSSSPSASSTGNANATTVSSSNSQGASNITTPTSQGNGGTQNSLVGQSESRSGNVTAASGTTTTDTSTMQSDSHSVQNASVNGSTACKGITAQASGPLN